MQSQRMNQVQNLEEQRKKKRKEEKKNGGWGVEGGRENKRGKKTKRDNKNKIKTLMRKKGHVPNGEGTEKAVTAAKEDETLR